MIDLPFSDKWVKRLSDFNKLYVGFSGGLDSTVLLHALNSVQELSPRLVAVHVNHELSPNADKWQAFCQQVADEHAIAFKAFKPYFPKLSNIEAQARKARYQIFSSLLTENDGLLLAHHSDDQAETVLLNLFRGTGIDGLCAMPEIKSLGAGQLIRPFLTCTRALLERYAKHHQLSWVDDESNADVSYARNFLRHTIMPLLNEKWPGISANLNRTAGHCQQAKASLVELAASDTQALSLMDSALPVSDLKQLSHTRLINVLRQWLENNQLRRPSTKRLDDLIDTLIYARQDANPCISWDTISIRRFQDTIYILENGPEHLPEHTHWRHFPEPLYIKGFGHLTVISAPSGFWVPEGSPVEIRFRQGGERIRLHGQLKSLKKLFQQWEIPPWKRGLIPLIYIDGQLAVVRDVISDDFYVSSSAYQIIMNEE